MDDDELPVLPGRLRRLAEELREEGVDVLTGAHDPVATLVELAYALRPQRFEGRTPTYGVILPPPGWALDAAGLIESGVALIALSDVDVQFARRFADGVTTFALRDDDQITHIACFDRNLADEYDLVGLQTSIGGIVVQRHANGQVRLFGPTGVVRWDGVAWHRDPPLAAWMHRLAELAPDLPTEGLRPLLRFAVHELAARRIGAILIWRPTDLSVPKHRHEPLVHNAPPLRLDRAGEAAALAQALSQTDGAALFDRDTALVGLGIRLAPSQDAARTVSAMRGMRHTSARRYSHDDPDALVVVVSESGTVTLMYCGQAYTTIERGDERIG
ncbi:MAG: hypothetical protein CL424_13875 [Acidimicrobiaceae bacterium]|nr:hypothetical protein [Acidimicrobiaceae bacterium]